MINAQLEATGDGEKEADGNSFSHRAVSAVGVVINTGPLHETCHDTARFEFVNRSIALQLDGEDKASGYRFSARKKLKACSCSWRVGGSGSDQVGQLQECLP